jgi:hypothetical protein
MLRQSSCYKMEVPLKMCTAIEQRGVVQFVWVNGTAAKDIHNEMLPMYGEHFLSCQAVCNWVQKFLQGQTSIKDEHESVGRWRLPRRQRIIRRRFPGTMKRCDKCLNLYGDYVEK